MSNEKQVQIVEGWVTPLYFEGYFYPLNWMGEDDETDFLIFDNPVYDKKRDGEVKVRVTVEIIDEAEQLKGAADE